MTSLDHVLDALVGVVSLVAPASFLITLLLARVFARDLGISGWNDQEKHRYVFAFSNNEEVPVNEQVTLSVRPLLKGGNIENAQLLAGPDCPQQFSAEKPKAGATWVVDAPSMRPLATWIVECRSNGAEGDVEFSVRIGKADLMKTLGRRSAPQRRKLGLAMRLLAILGALATYAGEKSFPGHLGRATGVGELNQVDGVMLTMIALAGLVTVLIMRPPTPAPVFGYMTTPRREDNPPR